MEFFRELSRIGAGFKKITITIMEKDGKQTVAFLPETNNDKANRKLIPVTLSGTPMEVDEGFFPNIIQTVEAVNGLTTNIEKVKEEIASTDKEDDDDDQSGEKKTSKKSVAKKKAAVKPAKKTAAKSAPKEKEKNEDVKKEEPPAAPTVGGLGF